VRVPRQDLPGGVRAVHPGHLQVHHDDIRADLVDEPDRVGPVRALGDDLDVRLAGEDLDQAVPAEVVVIDDHDTLHGASSAGLGRDTAAPPVSRQSRAPAGCCLTPPVTVGRDGDRAQLHLGGAKTPSARE
jgi:hypothetical protein